MDGGAEGGGSGGVHPVLARLTDPETSTRRTAVARARLARDPVTIALLDAGARVLAREVGALAPRRDDGGTGDDGDGGTGDDGRPVRFLELLSANRVCAAATAVGPLRVTPAHLRDRWPRHADYVEDLLAYGLWPRHRLGAVTRRLRSAPVPTSTDDLPDASVAVAEAHLVTSALPVTQRLDVIASALAPVRPALRAARVQGYAELEEVWSRVWVRYWGRTGQRLRPGRDVLEASRAAAALIDGANLRLLVLGDGPQAHAESVRLLVTSALALGRRSYEPAPPGVVVPAGAEELWPPDAPPDVAEVLTRITDPGTGRRRTAEGRRRLARDGITRQLLDGGLGVLGQELGVVATGPPGRVTELGGGASSHFFDVLSVAEVVAETRADGAAGATATAAQLRDRWPVQEHYVDDLLSYVTSSMRPVAGALAEELEDLTRGDGGDLRAAVAAAVHRRLRDLHSAPDAQLQLLLKALARTRPGVAAHLRDLHEAEEPAVRRLVARLLHARGARLRPDVELTDVCRALIALGEGLALRALATGDTGIDADGRSSVALRCGAELVRGFLIGPAERA